MKPGKAAATAHDRLAAVTNRGSTPPAAAYVPNSSNTKIQSTSAVNLAAAGRWDTPDTTKQNFQKELTI
jgi:hypothetical protein